MSSLMVLVPLGVVLSAIAVVFLLWAAKGRQFEDLKDLGERMPDELP